MHNLEIMDKFLETSNSSKIESGRNENLTKLITLMKLNQVIKKKKLQKNKCPGSGSFTGEFYQAFKETFKYFSKYSRKLKEEEHFQIQSMRPITTLVPKPGKNNTHTKL